MSPESIQNACIRLIQSADVGYLATADESGEPDIRCLSSLRNRSQFPSQAAFISAMNNPWVCFFSTGLSSNKIRQIRNNGKASLFFCDAPRFHGLTLKGAISIVGEPDIRAALWQNGWEQFYQGGLEGSEYGIIRFDPSHARGWFRDHLFEFEIPESSYRCLKNNGIP
ncbi:pyridoxamine 5'-phosphate oxidase family protein [bacterium]|nr:pyridoxamine 5'-phosphate oxidase family protein [bacterium]